MVWADHTLAAARLYVHGGAATVIDLGRGERHPAALAEDAWALKVAGLAAAVPVLEWARVSARGASFEGRNPSQDVAGRAAHELHVPREGVLYLIGGLDAEGHPVDQHAARFADGSSWRDVTWQARPPPGGRFGAASAREFVTVGGYANESGAAR